MAAIERGELAVTDPREERLQRLKRQEQESKPLKLAPSWRDTDAAALAGGVSPAAPATATHAASEHAPSVDSLAAPSPSLPAPAPKVSGAMPKLVTARSAPGPAAFTSAQRSESSRAMTPRTADEKAKAKAPANDARSRIFALSRSQSAQTDIEAQSKRDGQKGQDPTASDTEHEGAASDGMRPARERMLMSTQI